MKKEDIEFLRELKRKMTEEDGAALVLGPKGSATKTPEKAADRFLDALARAIEGRLREGVQERKG